MNKDKALKMAIEAMKWLRMRSPIIYEELEAEKACKEAIVSDVTDIDVGEIAQPAQEPVLNVVKILNEFPLLDDEGLDEDKHHCEWTLQQDRKRLHAMLKTHPAPAIEQEPVAVCKDSIVNWVNGKAIDGWLYTHPAPHLAQEPVAFTNKDELSELKSGMTTCYMYKQAIDDDDIALYTHPAPSWQGLSDDDKKKLHKEHHLYIPTIEKIESMLKENNHG